MGQRANNNKSGATPVKQAEAPKVNTNPEINVQSVKRALLSYAKADRWNKNTEYRMGFNDIAQGTIDAVANANIGFASDVAKTVAKYNYSISEKQAYVIANAAVQNNIGLNFQGADIIYRDNSKEAAALDARQRAARSARRAASRERKNSMKDVTSQARKLAESAGISTVGMRIIPYQGGYRTYIPNKSNPSKMDEVKIPGFND